MLIDHAIRTWKLSSLSPPKYPIPQTRRREPLHNSSGILQYLPTYPQHCCIIPVPSEVTDSCTGNSTSNVCRSLSALTDVVMVSPYCSESLLCSQQLRSISEAFVLQCPLPISRCSTCFLRVPSRLTFQWIDSRFVESQVLPLVLSHQTLLHSAAQVALGQLSTFFIILSPFVPETS